MIETLIRFWRGYVQIKVEGDSPERFLNLCRYHKRNIWNLQWNENTMICSVFLKDFFELKSLIKKSGVKIRIVQKRGIPFFVEKNKKRKAAYLSAGISLIGIYILSLFLWDIQFEGNIHYTDDVLLQFLNQNGYVHGMKLTDIQCEELEKKIRNTYSDINWVSAMIKGTRLVVKVKENSAVLAEEEEKESPQDLVADRDGTIVSIITRQGTPQVHAGDQVKKGETLVAGKVELKNDAGEVEKTHFVKADADIVIEWSEAYQTDFPLLHEERNYIDARSNYFVQIFDWRFQIMPINKKENMEIYTEKNQIHLFSNFYLPFYYGVSTVKVYEPVEKEYSEEEARKLAEEKWEQYLKEKTEEGKKIVQSNVNIQIDETRCEIEGTLTAREKGGIGMEIVQEE